MKKFTFCKHYNAKKIKYEPKRFFCCDKEVLLVNSKMPDELFDLFTSDSEEAKEFYTNIQ